MASKPSSNGFHEDSFEGSAAGSAVQAALPTAPPPKTQEELDQEEEDRYFAMMEQQAMGVEEDGGPLDPMEELLPAGAGGELDEEAYFSNVEKVNVALSDAGIRGEDDPIWFEVHRRLLVDGDTAAQR